MNSVTQKGPQTLKIVFLTLFLDLVGFSIIFPLFPDLLDYYIPEAYTSGSTSLLAQLIAPLYRLAELSSHSDPKFITTVLFGGILGSFYSLLQFIFAPIWGSLSDTHGRKKILLITIAGLALSYLIWGLSGNFWILIIARLVGGVMGGNLSVATAVVADVTPKEKRTSGMAIVGIAFGLGFIMGPAIGGFLGQFNLLDSYPSLASFGINPFSITAFFSLLLSLINLVWVYFKFEETLPSEARNKTQPEPFKLFSLFHHKNKQIKSLNLTYLIYMTAFSGMEFTLTFLAVDRFLFSTVQNGIMFVYIGLLLVITQGLLVRRFSPVLGEYKLSTFGLASGVVAFILLSQSTEIILFFIALAFMALSIGLTSPSMSALVSLSANEQEQGEILGLFRSAGSFARTIGPLIASSMYFLLGDRVAYLLGAFLVIIALFLFNYKVSLRTKNTGDANPA
jgi:MFS family permease